MILAAGGGGLSVAFDMPTLMGRDSDDPRSLGEVGHCGVAIDSAADMEVLFSDIPLGDVTTSMTISGPAVPVFCMYLVAAERQGVDPGVAQRHAADRHLQGVHRAEGVALPAGAAPAPHRRPDGALRREDPGLQADLGLRLPHPRGRLDRRAGARVHARRRLRLRRARACRAGMDVDVFAPGLSFFFDAHVDFFEEIAKFRAARRIWARWLRDVYGAKTEKAQWLRFHTQTAGVSLTAQQPDNNVVRTAVEALAAVLGGTNSLHTNALDEVLALPSEKAAQIALRTQQVIAEETGVMNVADPLGGSWYVEQLTDDIEAQAEAIFAKIRDMGTDGDDDLAASCAASRTAGSWPRSPRRPSRTRWPSRRATRRSSASTCTPATSTTPLEILRVSHEVEKEQVRELGSRKAQRDEAEVQARAGRRWSRSPQGEGNTIPPMLDAIRAEATLGEVCGALRDLWGSYTEPPRF